MFHVEITGNDDDDDEVQAGLLGYDWHLSITIELVLLKFSNDRL
jgi:hypothetical protein